MHTIQTPQHHTLNMSDGLVLALSFAEAKVGLGKARIEYLRKYHVDALTHDSIHHNGYSKLPHLGSAFLWNEGSPNRFGL